MATIPVEMIWRGWLFRLGQKCEENETAFRPVSLLIA
jgi:hypothetical protein